MTWNIAFVSCIWWGEGRECGGVRDKPHSYLSWLRTLMAEKSSPDLQISIVVLSRGGDKVGCSLPASHGYNIEYTLGWFCVCALVKSHSNVWSHCLTKPGSGNTISNIVLVSLVHVFEYVEWGKTRRVKILNSEHRKRAGNRFFLAQKREDLKGIGD